MPERFAPVFRDRDELATATNLGATLIASLEQSACQIVICSRKAAKSRWVNEEILTFKRLGKAHRIFSLIVDGEPGASANPQLADLECFPNALIYRLGEDGNLTSERGEPIAADVRPRKDRKQDALLKLLAGMLGIGLDELKRREARRRQQRMIALVAASVTGMVITSALATAAWLARNEAQRAARHRGQRGRNREADHPIHGRPVQGLGSQRGTRKYHHRKGDPRQGRGAHRDRAGRASRRSRRR